MAEPVLYTSYFGNVHNISPGPRLVSIARGTPQWFKDETLPPQFDMVAPEYPLLKGYKAGKISKDEYVGIYLKQLSRLHVPNFVSYYDGSVLLCYEKVGDFCHRHILAMFLKRYGFRIEELRTS